MSIEISKGVALILDATEKKVTIKGGKKDGSVASVALITGLLNDSIKSEISDSDRKALNDFYFANLYVAPTVTLESIKQEHEKNLKQEHEMMTSFFNNKKEDVKAQLSDIKTALECLTRLRGKGQYQSFSRTIDELNKKEVLISTEYARLKDSLIAEYNTNKQRIIDEYEKRVEMFNKANKDKQLGEEEKKPNPPVAPAPKEKEEQAEPYSPPPKKGEPKDAPVAPKAPTNKDEVLDKMEDDSFPF